MEVHLVHFNENYGNFQNATNQPDGLAVIAFFIQASGNQDCKLFQKIIDKLSQIHEPNTKCFLDSGIRYSRRIHSFNIKYLFIYFRLPVMAFISRIAKALLYLPWFANHISIQRMCYMDYLSNANLHFNATGLRKILNN